MTPFSQLFGTPRLVFFLFLFGLIITHIFLYVSFFDKEFDLIFQLLTLFGVMAMVLVVGTIFCFVCMRVVPHRLWLLDIGSLAMAFRIFSLSRACNLEIFCVVLLSLLDFLSFLFSSALMVGQFCLFHGQTLWSSHVACSHFLNFDKSLCLRDNLVHVVYFSIIEGIMQILIYHICLESLHQKLLFGSLTWRRPLWTS